MFYALYVVNYYYQNNCEGGKSLNLSSYGPTYMQVEINAQEVNVQLEKCPSFSSQVLEGGGSDKKYPGAQLAERVLKSEL